MIGGQRIVGLGILVSVSTLEFKPELEPERDNSMSRNQKDRIFKKNITRPIPKGAELFERSGQRFAKWTDKLGQKFEAPLNDTNRIQVQSETFYCSYLGASGKVITVSLETSDEKLAYRRFLELTKQSAGIRSGELSPSDLQKSENKKIPIADLVMEFDDWIRGKGTTDRHNRAVISRLKSPIGMINLKAVGDICRCDAVKLIDKATAGFQSYLKLRLHWQHSEGVIKRPTSPNLYGNLGGFGLNRDHFLICVLKSPPSVMTIP